MKTFVIGLMALLFLPWAASVAAHGGSFGSFGGSGMLAMSSDNSRNDLGSSGVSGLVESSGGGGGANFSGTESGVIAPEARGGDSVSPGPAATRNSLPFDDDAQPGTRAPRRSNHRWQSLVPGAIK